MSFRHTGTRDWRGRALLVVIATLVAVAMVVAWGTVRLSRSSAHLLAATTQAAGAADTAGLPADLEQEIAANDLAGLPGLGRGVAVPAGCDIATDTDPAVGRPRIEHERTVHRQLNQGNSAAFVAAGNAQLQAYLQVSVRDYCATHA